MPTRTSSIPGPASSSSTSIARRFVASKRLQEPRVLVAVWALCAETDEQADELAASARMTMMLARRGRFTPVPRVETAVRFIERRTRTDAPGEALNKRMVTGAPATVHDALRALAGGYDTDELMVLTVTHDHAARRRSYELLAERFSLM